MTTPPTGLRVFVWLLALLVVGLAGLCVFQHFESGFATRAAADAKGRTADLARQAALRAKAAAAQQSLAARIPARATTWSWSQQLPTMLTQVAALAKQSGASVDTLQPGPPVTRDAVTRFPLRLTMNATLKATAGLLERAATAKPALAVDQLLMRPGEKPGDPLHVEMTLSAYVMAKGDGR